MPNFGLFFSVDLFPRKYLKISSSSMFQGIIILFTSPCPRPQNQKLQVPKASFPQPTKRHLRFKRRTVAKEALPFTQICLAGLTFANIGSWRFSSSFAEKIQEKKNLFWLLKFKKEGTGWCVNIRLRSICDIHTLTQNACAKYASSCPDKILKAIEIEFEDPFYF